MCQAICEDGICIAPTAVSWTCGGTSCYWMAKQSRLPTQLCWPQLSPMTFDKIHKRAAWTICTTSSHKDCKRRCCLSAVIVGNLYRAVGLIECNAHSIIELRITFVNLCRVRVVAFAGDHTAGRNGSFSKTSSNIGRQAVAILELASGPENHAFLGPSCKLGLCSSCKRTLLYPDGSVFMSES
jgi:hypothetical protein